MELGSWTAKVCASVDRQTDRQRHFLHDGPGSAHKFYLGTKISMLWCNAEHLDKQMMAGRLDCSCTFVRVGPCLPQPPSFPEAPLDPSRHDLLHFFEALVCLSGQKMGNYIILVIRGWCHGRLVPPQACLPRYTGILSRPRCQACPFCCHPASVDVEHGPGKGSTSTHFVGSNDVSQHWRARGRGPGTVISSTQFGPWSADKNVLVPVARSAVAS